VNFPVVPSPAIDPRALHTFRRTIEREFSFLKEAVSLEQSFARSLALPESGGMLQPVGRQFLEDDELIRQLGAWRSACRNAYPTRFPVTEAGTRRWLEKGVFDVPDRLLFLVLDRHGHRLGHLGFAHCLGEEATMEVDNVVRGVPGRAPGIMAEAMCVLLHWARTTLWPEGFALRVLADNVRARAFYARLGWTERARQPLRLVVEGETESLVVIPAGDTAAPDNAWITMRPGPLAPAAGSRTILTAGPSVSAREAAYSLDAAKYGWNDRWSDYLKKFEAAFAGYVGTRHALATSSCTGALHLALAALGIGPGDEVIVPDLTWVATGNAVLYVGATPVFADVDPQSWCLDPESFRAKITPRTKAVMPVHLYGHPCAMDEIGRIAREHGLFVVEDAAPSVGAEYQGRRVGSFGDFAAFSFQGAKLAVTGEGGMLVTSDEALYEKVHTIWDQGRVPGTFWIGSRGWKYKLANLPAAFGLGQLERNDAMVEAKRRIFGWYEAGLRNVPHLTLARETAGARSIYWMTSVLLAADAPVGRDLVIARLKEHRIDSRPVFPAISQYPIWPVAQPPGPQAASIGRRAINLPSGVCLAREEVDYVCATLREILAAG
jgi:perosamine synthetase